MVIITFLIACISILLLYNNAQKDAYYRLTDIVNREKSTIVVLINTHQTNETEIIEHFTRVNEVGSTIGEYGEIVIAREINDSIEFLISKKQGNENLVISRDISIASPMRKALNGESGFIKDYDYDGIKVIAAYTFEEHLNWGIVAKIPTSEINKPYKIAIIIVFILATVFMTFFSLLFFNLANPIIDSLQKSEQLLFESKKRAEESEANLNSLINNRGESIWSIDRNYNYNIINKFFEEAYFARFNIELKKGMNSLKIITPDLVELWKPKYDTALSGEKVVFEFPNQVEDTLRIYEVTLNPIILEGEITGVSGLTVDITEREQASKVLLRSEANLSAIIENTEDSIWAINTSYEILYANANFVSAFEASFGVHLEPDVNLLMALPEPMRPLWKPRYERVLGNERFSFVDRIDLENSSIYIEVFTNPIVVDDNVIGASFFGSDITERKQVEDELKSNYSILRLAGETAKFGGWSVNIEENKTHWSDEVAAIHEMPAGYSPTVTEGINYYAPEWKDKISKAFSNCAEKGIPYDEVMQIITDSGKHVWVRTTGEPVKDKNGKIIYVQGSFQDVNNSKQAEEKLIQLNHKLKALNSTKDKLFSIIAHDLKSPFNGILGFSELLSENIRTYPIEKTEEIIAIINSSSKQTLSLLENLLAWSNTQTGQIDFKPENHKMQPIIQAIVNVFNSSATIKNITINYHQTEDVIAYADLNMLKTVLRNLIHNAIKFTDSGGRVDIHALSDQKQIEISIADNGVGMNEETLNNLFRMNTTTTSAGTANEKGSGLGLVLCREFVENHGGKIWVESDVGKGSKFVFTLPLKGSTGK